MPNEVAECPLCNGASEIAGSQPANYYVVCLTCGCAGPVGYHDEVVGKWNTRPSRLTQAGAGEGVPGYDGERIEAIIQGLREFKQYPEAIDAIDLLHKVRALVDGRTKPSPSGWDAAVEACAQAAYRWWDGEPEDAEELRSHIRALASKGGEEVASLDRDAVLEILRRALSDENSKFKSRTAILIDAANEIVALDLTPLRSTETGEECARELLAQSCADEDLAKDVREKTGRYGGLVPISAALRAIATALASPSLECREVVEVLEPFAAITRGEIYARFVADAKMTFRLTDGNKDKTLTFINAECFEAAAALLSSLKGADRRG